MKTFYKLSLTIAIVAGLSVGAQAQINYGGGTYTQNFDGMGATGTTTPTGWFVGAGAGPAVTGTTVVPGTGSSNFPGNYNFGVSGVHGIDERALGSNADRTGSQEDSEVDFVNLTGSSIAQFSIGYTGEEWRNGGSGNPNTLTLQLSTNGITWTSLGSAFNFTSPVNTGGATALDGNAPANRITGIGGTFSPSVPIASGATFYLRFADPDDPGLDSSIAVDDFTFTIVPEPSTYMLLGVGLLLCGQRFLRPSAYRSATRTGPVS